MTKFSLSGRLLLAFAVATLAGTALHFLYGMFPSPVTALFSPVRESIWEHLKLLYWPYLAAMLAVTGKAGQGSRGGWLFTLLLISVAMLIAGYVYYISLGGQSMAFGIGLYVILMALGFWLPGRLNRADGRSGPVFLLVLLLGAALILFTFFPAEHVLFADLSAVHTWYTIPC